MSGRIRSIKPEILDDDLAGQLDHDEWRLFVSLWLIADDYGNFRANPSQVEAAIFWGRPPSRSTRELLARLSQLGLIRLYVVRGQPYGAITNWSKHQKVDKPSRPRVPGPQDSESIQDPEGLAESSPKAREAPASPREGPENDLRSPISDLRSTTTSAREGVERRKDPFADAFTPRRQRQDVQAAFTCWQTITGKHNAELDERRAVVLAERIDAGATVDDHRDAVLGATCDKWATENHLKISIIFGDPERFEGFRDAGRAQRSGAPPGMVPEDQAELERVRKARERGAAIGLRMREETAARIAKLTAGEPVSVRVPTTPDEAAALLAELSSGIGGAG